MTNEQKKDIEALQALVTKLVDRQSFSSEEALQGNRVAISNTLNMHPASAYLKQNVPNPFNATTTIEYYVPGTVRRAVIDVVSANGQLVKSYPAEKGQGRISIERGTLAVGTYHYILSLDGVKTDTKQMIIAQ